MVPAISLESRVRGLLVGLGLGDAVGKVGGDVPGHGPLLSGVSSQLACFTTEGIIRAWERGRHKGICHPPSVVWHAYCRWAVLQGIEADRIRERWTPGTADTWPDGWLAAVPVLSERRGSAPATVTALIGLEQGSVRRPVTTSRGCHAVTRTLPTGALVLEQSTTPPDLACEIAALTHGDPEAHAAAATATMVASQCLVRDSIHAAFAAAIDAIRERSSAALLHQSLYEALDQARKRPGEVTALTRLAPDAGASSALNGGLYVAASFPGEDDITTALHLAARAPDGDSVACVAGAFLGAVHGIEVLPVHLVGRLELVWVLDTLARDLVAELTGLPGGDEFGDPTDAFWWRRYPGW